jgi:hypothetical protein
MLKNFSEEIHECYRHAEQARQRAEVTRNDFFDLERRWRSYAGKWVMTE